MFLSVILNLKCAGREGGSVKLNCGGRYPPKKFRSPHQCAFENGIALIYKTIHVSIRKLSFPTNTCTNEYV